MRRFDTPRVFACLNLLPAYVLGAGCYILPARFAPLDFAVIALVVCLVTTSVLVFVRPDLARRALRVAGIALLVVGLGIFAMFALTATFLHSVHGSYGELGVLLMSLVLLLVAPYVLAYPCLLLLWLSKRMQPASERSAPHGVASVTETPQAAQ